MEQKIYRLQGRKTVMYSLCVMARNKIEAIQKAKRGEVLTGQIEYEPPGYMLESSGSIKVEEVSE